MKMLFAIAAAGIMIEFDSTNTGQRAERTRPASKSATETKQSRRGWQAGKKDRAQAVAGACIAGCPAAKVKAK